MADQALIGLLRSDLQLARNALFATAKLVALFLVNIWGTEKLGLAIFAAWVLGAALSLLALAALAVAGGCISGRSRPRWELLRGMGSAVFSHYSLNVALQAPSLALPVLVTALLSTTMNAYFYAAWMLAGFMFVGPVALSMSLYAVSSRAPEELVQRVRFTLALGFGGAALANALVLIGAERLLALFGGDYAEQTGWSLRILVLGMFPLVVRMHYVTIRRIHGELIGTAALVGAGGLLGLTLATFGAMYAGFVGLSLGWIAASCIEAALMMRVVYRTAYPAGLLLWRFSG